MAAEADSCIKQCHPLTVEPLQTRSLVTTDRCRLGVCRGNNNNLKGPLLLLSLFYFALSLCLYLPLSFTAGLYQWSWSMSYCHVLMWFMSQAVKSTYLPPLPILSILSPSPLPPSPPPLLPYRGLSPSVSASLAPPAETGRRGLVGEVWDENSFSDIHLLFKLWAWSKSVYGSFCLFVCF